ncbi:MAG: cell division protein FtsA, partial [Oscillospiraceae bacterium]|nr:cell division protein FtsA [Oscillospiraceae bacterium]
MAQYTQQEKDLIYALDIGTRSVIGIVGRMEGERFKVLAVDQEEHGKRAMMDGQIDDIERVAGVARIVTGR